MKFFIGPMPYQSWNQPIVSVVRYDELYLFILYYILLYCDVKLKMKYNITQNSDPIHWHGIDIDLAVEQKESVSKLQPDKKQNT
jgi:hypothetical protein